MLVENLNGETLETLTIGDRVFYPAHGVAAVTGEEERDFGGIKQSFYVLELERGGSVMVPVGKVDRAGVRSLVNADQARELMKLVMTDPQVEIKLDHASRKRRYALYAEALKSGSALRYTEILQELLFRLRTDKLSSSEQQTLDTARSYFVGEVGVGLDLTADQCDAELGLAPSSSS